MRDIIAALRDDARFARRSTREKLAEDARARCERARGRAIERERGAASIASRWAA